MKTKNAPKDLKRKINHTFFLETGVPKRGGGGPTLGKNSQKIPFFLGVASLITLEMPLSMQVRLLHCALNGHLCLKGVKCRL